MNFLALPALWKLAPVLLCGSHDGHYDLPGHAADDAALRTSQSHTLFSSIWPVYFVSAGNKLGPQMTAQANIAA